MVYFVDSSALVKRHVVEVGSMWVRQIAHPSAGNRIHIARITAVEVISALARRQRAGSLMASDTAIAMAEFRTWLVAEAYIQDTTALVLDRAALLAENHALRGYDAVQLASALTVNAERVALKLPPLTLVSADGELNAAAQAEGLAVEDPNAYP